MPVNISINTNTIAVQENINYISVNDPNNPNIVDITQPVTNIVEVITAGPQGPPGPSGSVGPSGTIDTGSFVTTSSFNAFTSSYNTGSFTGSFSGSLFGTSSFAVSSSYALTASFATNALTASYIPTLQQVTTAGATTTDSIVSTPVVENTFGFLGTVTDNSYSENYAGVKGVGFGYANGVVGIGAADSYGVYGYNEYGVGITGTSINSTGTTGYSTNGAGVSGGSTNFRGIEASSITSTALVAIIPTGNTSNIAEFQKNSVNQASISHDGTIVSNKSLINTAVDNGIDKLQVSGSTNINGNTRITGSLNVTNGITGSLFGTSSWANRSISSSFATNSTSASYALTSSYAINAATASNILGGKATHLPFFNTDTTLATSSIYQSGSTSIIINQDNNTTENPEALYVWQPHPTSINVISGKGNLNNYLQLNIQNTNQGTAASSDIVATADNGNETTNYIDMGINSENFSGAIGGPNDAYLYSAGQHLHIGNTTPNKPIQFFVGGADSNADRKFELNANGQHNMTGSLEISQKLVVLGGITGSLYGTASWALNSRTASYAINANSSLTSVSASYANNADSSLTSISASHAIQADNALTANYANTAGNGGVTNIVAGSGIVLPFGGTGAVTIVSSGGGGVTIISGSAVTSSFVNLNTWTFNHNLGTRTPTITVFDSDYNQIIPQNIQLISTSSATITFPTLESGFAIASTGGTTGTALSSSYSLFATYADSASYFLETDPVYIAQKPTLATTGSNIFRGNQTITGSVYISPGSSLNLNGNTLYSSASTLFTNANIVPTQHNTQSLGTTTERWKDIWLGGGSIYIADTVIPNSDLVVEAINNIFTVSGSAGLEVGSFKFIDNELFLKNEAIPIIIGSGSSTAPVQLNRPLEIISGDTGNITFRATREGRVAIISPNIPANDIGAFSIIGNPSGSYQPVINPSGMIHVTSNDNQAARITVDGFGSNIGAIYVGRHARGTAATPTPTLSGDILARYAGLGYATSSYFPVVGAVPTSLEFQATENYSTSSYGSRAAFYTYANGAISRSLSAIIDATGITIPSSSLLFGTASWALNTLTASYVTSSNIVGTVLSSSYALTASHALNVQIIDTGSFATTGSNTFIGNQIVSGSLKVSGSLTEIGTTVMSGSLTLSSGSALNLNDGFFVNGHKQFQYASFYHTASQTLTSATTPLPFQFSTIENNSGAFTVALSGSRRSRITTNTTGWWNIQYSAQVTNGSSFNNYDSYTWIRVNEVNTTNSNNIRTIPQDAFDLLASRNTLIYLESGSYFEIMYGAASTQVSFPYTGTATSPTRPATPSISLVVTQHA